MAGLCLNPKMGIVFMKKDDYETPMQTWADIARFIPNNKTIYDPFYSTGLSGTYMREIFKSNKIIHTNTDFFEEYKKNEFDMILTNPPFSKKIQILKELRIINKPFMMLIPVTALASQYIFTIFKNELQIIIPAKRIQFILNGVQSTRNCFSCIWVCWKMCLKKDITYL